MRLRNVLLPSLALSLSGCDILSGKCTFEDRSLETDGVIQENGGELVSAHVTLSENRGSLQGTNMYWLVTGATLKGHVLAATLRDAANPSQARLDLPLSTADRSEIAEGGADTRDGTNLGGIHDFLAAGRGIIQLETDLPSRPTIALPLAATRVGDWIRPNCS